MVGCEPTLEVCYCNEVWNVAGPSFFKMVCEKVSWSFFKVFDAEDLKMSDTKNMTHMSF